MRGFKLFINLNDLQHQKYQQANKLFITESNMNGNPTHFSIKSFALDMFRYISVCKNNKRRHRKEQTVRSDMYKMKIKTDRGSNYSQVKKNESLFFIYQLVMIGEIQKNRFTNQIII
jgi:hypothetical protein